MGPDLEKQQVFGATLDRKPVPESVGAPSHSMEPQMPPPVEENPFHDSASAEKPGSTSPPLGRTPSKAVAMEVNECTMWPSLEQLKKRARHDKKARTKNPMVRLGKKGKIIVSVIIAMCIMGLAVGIGVGVSRATHGEVWAGNGKTNPIPS